MEAYKFPHTCSFINASNECIQEMEKLNVATKTYREKKVTY